MPRLTPSPRSTTADAFRSAGAASEWFHKERAVSAEANALVAQDQGARPSAASQQGWTSVPDKIKWEQSTRHWIDANAEKGLDCVVRGPIFGRPRESFKGGRPNRPVPLPPHLRMFQ